MYQLDAVMGAPLHELLIEHVLLVKALFGTRAQPSTPLRQRHRKGYPFKGQIERERERAQQAELALVPQLPQSLVLTYE